MTSVAKAAQPEKGASAPFFLTLHNMPLKHRFRWLVFLLAASAWMLLAHPYEGLRHDGVLYFGQSLLHSRVPALDHDVFFAAGSQDRYSIFAHLMGPLYVAVGQPAAHMGVLLTGWLATGAAVLALLARFEPSGSASWWGLLAVAVMSPIYGGGWIFSYSEPFVTARSFAEPLLLWSLVALMSGRRAVAVGLQAFAGLFHPLMALPIVAITWCYFVRTDWRWLWLLIALPAVLFAGAADLSPWSSLFQTYDPYWWALVSTGNHQVLIGNWTLEDKLTVVLDLAMLIAVTRLRADDAGTRLLMAIVATTLGLLAISALCADVFRSVLLTQSQLWRVHWIAHLTATALSPWLAATLWARKGLWRVSACALILSLLNSHIGTNHGLATLSLWALVSLAAWKVKGLSPMTTRLAGVAILLSALALSAYQIDSLLAQQAWQQPQADWGTRLVIVAGFPTVAMLGFGGLMLLAARTGIVAWLALGLSALLLWAAWVNWDQRSDLALAVESREPTPHPFAAHLPPLASVYWAGQLAPVWGLLERPSHYSPQQGAGVLFNRHTGLIFGPRKETYRSINEDHKRCVTSAQLGRDGKALLRCDMPKEDRLVTLCQQADKPDFLVLPGRLSITPLATWQPPARHDQPQTFTLYACAQLTQES